LGDKKDIAGYADDLREDINQFISGKLGDFIPKEKLVLW
jgi:hypothetical protein